MKKKQKLLKAAPEVIKTQSLVFIFLLAFVVRAVFIFQWNSMPYAGFPLIDAQSYDKWAQDVLTQGFIGKSAFYQSPAYPYLLAFIYRIFGHSYYVVSWIQVLLGSLTCSMIALIGSKCFSTRAGLSAGILVALYKPLIFFTAPLMKETIGVLTFAWFLLAFVILEEKNQKWNFLWAGILFGLAALFRGNILLLAPPLFLFWLFQHKKFALKRIALFAAGMSLPLSLTLAHNLYTSGDFVLINSCGGFNFFIGNNEASTGYGIYPDGISTDPAREEIDVSRIAENSVGRKLLPSEVSKYWSGQAWNYIASHPMAWFQVFLKKAAIFWNDYEEPDNYDQGFITKNFTSILSLPLVTFGLLAALALWGAIIGLKNYKHGFILGLFTIVFMISVIMFYVTDRYRLLVVVLLFPFAGLAVDNLITKIKSRNWASLAVPAFVIFSFFSLSTFPQITDKSSGRSSSWGHLASIYFSMGKFEESILSIEKSMDILPRAPGWYALIAGARSFEALGKFGEAESLYNNGLLLYPNSAELLNAFGVFLLPRGRTQDAVDKFERAIASGTDLPEPFKNLFVIYSRMGKKDLAENYGNKALALSPDDEKFKLIYQKYSQR